MSSPPAGSPPASSSSNGPSKRRVSLASGAHPKKPKLNRKPSLVGPPTPRPGHPLRQTSFPPEERDGLERSPSVDSDDGGGVGMGVGVGRRGLQLPGGSSNAGPGGASGAGKYDQAGPSTVNNNNNNEEEDDEDRGDDFGTTSLLAGGGTGGFVNDAEEKRKLALLLENFDADQMSRYEAFRRSNLNKAAVKKIANQVLTQSVTANVGTVIGGFCKVYVSEILERAIDIQKQWGDVGPLLPDHLREAQRRYRAEQAGAVGHRYMGGTNNGPGPGAGDAVGGGVGRLFR